MWKHLSLALRVLRHARYVKHNVFVERGYGLLVIIALIMRLRISAPD